MAKRVIRTHRARVGSVGSPSHVRYGHRSGPTQVSLVCPNCGAEALAALPCSGAGVYVIGDLSPFWRAAAWQVACRTCTHRAGPFDYEGMRAHAPLYFTVAGSGQDLWAWNREHLHMLLDVFAGGDGSTSPYAWLTTYIPGHWKARAAHYEKLARRLLAI